VPPRHGVDPELRDRLAADYALGTLRGPARKRMRRLMSDDPSLADSVEDWELRLNLLAESAPAVEPPSDLWSKIAARLEPASQVAPSGWLNGLWDSARFWRGIGALAAATAAALGLQVALQSPRLDPDLIAALDERLARIESATRDLAGTPGEIATFATRLSTMESRLNATTLAPQPCRGADRQVPAADDDRRSECRRRPAGAAAQHHPAAGFLRQNA
jgi:hypothetical protein